MHPITDPISIVIPMFNEYDNVAPFIAEVAEAAQKFAAREIIVVNDGSHDGTGEILELLKKQYPELTVIHHEGNYGQSAAVLTGVRCAKHELIATLDGDGQNDPSDIEKLYQAGSQHNINQHFMLVGGVRVKRVDNWLKRISSKIANLVRQTILRDKTPDTGCGIKLFRRKDFLNLPHFNHLHRFLPALYQRAGGQVIHVPVNHRPRLQGQSKYGVLNRLFVGIYDLIGVGWLMRRAINPKIAEANK